MRKRLITRRSALLAAPALIIATRSIAKGHGTPWSDGAANASTGSVQYPSLLNGYTLRPPWKVAGVDYAVGINNGVSLKDPTVDANWNSAVGAGNWSRQTASDGMPYIVINVPATIDGWDFSLGAAGKGTGLNINASNCTISNCNFACNFINGTGSILQNNGGFSNLTIIRNKFTQLGVTPNAGGALVQAQCIGTITFQYNWVSSIFADVIVPLARGVGQAVFLDYRYNFLENAAINFDQHLNLIEWSADGAAFNGSISGTTLTVSAVATGALNAFPIPIYGLGPNGLGYTPITLAPGFIITGQLTGGGGGTGTYTVTNPSGTSPSGGMFTIGQCDMSCLVAFNTCRQQVQAGSGETFQLYINVGGGRVGSQKVLNNTIISQNTASRTVLTRQNSHTYNYLDIIDGATLNSPVANTYFFCMSVPSGVSAGAEPSAAYASATFQSTFADGTALMAPNTRNQAYSNCLVGNSGFTGVGMNTVFVGPTLWADNYFDLTSVSSGSFYKTDGSAHGATVGQNWNMLTGAAFSFP